VRRALAAGESVLRAAWLLAPAAVRGAFAATPDTADAPWVFADGNLPSVVDALAAASDRHFHAKLCFAAHSSFFLI
jgi:hypothetical protein